MDNHRNKPIDSKITGKNKAIFMSLLKQYFPEAVKDGIVDYKALKECMGEFGEVTEEHYEFVWAGKQTSKQEALSDPDGKKLQYKPQDSLHPDSTRNLYIEGDNLEVLKLLRESYGGKIGLIYIDPPYNTGNDFVYHDDFSITKRELVKKSGIRAKKNCTEGSLYHTKWLNMMYPRLKAARELLSEDGVIFISIDDNEQDNLKKLCDEIFGEDNFITKFIWEKTQHFGRQKVNYYCNCEYIYCYAKHLLSEKGIKELLIEYVKTEFMDAPLYNASNRENEILFPAGSTSFKIPDGIYHTATDDKFTLLNEVIVRNGKNVNDFSIRFRSRWSAAKVMDEWKKGTTYLVKSTNFSIRTVYAKGKSFNESPRQLIFTNQKNGSVTRNRYGTKVGTNEEGSAELDELKIKGFSYPKPVSLLTYLISLYRDTDVTVLDFFSGSATTAHAVMQLNAQDGGSRQFIMVQQPEICDEKSQAAKAGFQNICEIGKERLRRAADKIHKSCPEAKFDDGFKVYEAVGTDE